MVVINPVVITPGVAEAAIKRCDVTANPPLWATPTDREVAYEAWLTCDPAILPGTFNNTVCVQAKTGSSFVDIQCVKIPKTRVSVDSMVDGCGIMAASRRDIRVPDPCPCVPRGERALSKTHFSTAVTITS